VHTYIAMGITHSEFCLYFCLYTHKLQYICTVQFQFPIRQQKFQAEPLVESLALHELIDDRIKDTNDTYGLYHLAKIAYLCARPNPEQRPSMGEVSLENCYIT
jgi:hypothetical protein